MYDVSIARLIPIIKLTLDSDKIDLKLVEVFQNLKHGLKVERMTKKMMFK